MPTDMDEREAELQAEEERRWANAPTPPPCPSWCEETGTESVAYTSASSDPNDQRFYRFHSAKIADKVLITQEESATEAGDVTLSPVRVTVSVENEDLDAKEARQLARDLLIAADRLDEIVAPS